MSINSIHNSRIKYNEAIKVKQSRMLAAMSSMGMGSYLSDTSDMYVQFLKDITSILRMTNYISHYYSVCSMWFSDGRLCEYDPVNVDMAYFNFEVRNSNYNSSFTVTSGQYREDDLYIKVDEYVLGLILGEIEKLIKDLKRKEEESKYLPSSEDLMKTLLRYANKYIDLNTLSVNIEHGKLNSESVSYDCMVIRHKDDNSYCASMTLYKNRIGEYFITKRVPLCGESKIQFTIDDAERTIKELVSNL